MSKYILIHGQFHELPDDELMHWKYIKREKVNGKWKYYYDLGETQKKNYEQAKKNYDTRKAQIEKAATQRKPIANDKESNWGDSLLRYWRVDNSGDKRGSFDKDGRYREQSRAIDTLENKMKEAEKEYRKTPLGKRETRAEKAKEITTKAKSWAKDKLGYDEKQAMDAAKTAAKVARYAAQDEVKRDTEWQAKNPGVMDDLLDWSKGYHFKLAASAWGKAKEATEKYEKTPLAKIEKASAKIDSVKDYVHELVTNERGEKAHDELRKAKFDLRNALAKEDYHRNQYEEVLRKTKSGEYFDKDRGNTAMINEWKVDADKAKQESEAALERVKKARAEYDATPMGKREKRENERKQRKSRR